MRENEILKQAEDSIRKWRCIDRAPKGYVLSAAQLLLNYCKELEKRVQELEKINKNVEL